MNLANQLTIIRIGILPIFILCLAIKELITIVLALFLFLMAAITDLYDGCVARQRKVETTWGKVMDPMADKLLVLSSLIFFVGIPYLGIPSWMVILIVVREFCITSLRLIGLSKGITIAAASEGKAKTLFQMLTVIIIFCIIIIKETRSSLPLNESIPLVLISLTVIFTLISGLTYIIRYKELILSPHE